MQEPGKKYALRSGLILTGFLVGFALLFLQYPLNKFFPGNVDIWYHLAVFNDYYNRLFGPPCGEAMYPVGHLFSFGETTFITGGFFVLFKLMHFSDLWAYYLLIVLTYALNGWGTFLLSRSFGVSFRSAVFAGIAFSTCNFLLGNIEGINYIFFFPGLLSLYFYRQFTMEPSYRNIILAAMFGALQIYSASYLFLFTVGILTVLHLQNFAISKEKVSFLLKSLIPVALALLIISPYIYFYANNAYLDISENRVNVFLSPHGSLLLKDLFRTLVHNALYPKVAYFPNEPAISEIHSAFPGIVVLFLACLALIRDFKKWFLWLIIAAIGLLLALGPYIYWSSDSEAVRSPLYFFFELTNSKILRIPIRTYDITMLALCLMAAGGLDRLVKPGLKSIIITIIFFVLMMLENLSFPLPKHANKNMARVPEGYLETLKSRCKPDAVLLNLPVGVESQGMTPDFNQRMSCEYIYHYWQTKHCLNMLNGLSGFTPPQRDRLGELTNNLDSPAKMDKLIKDVPFDAVALHRRFMTDEAYYYQLELIRQRPELTIGYVSDSLMIFIKKQHQGGK